MSNKRGIKRYIEILSGFFLPLAVISLMVAYLLKFEYTHPDDTFQEDMEYLFDNLNSQKLSSIAWLVSGSLHLILMPVFLLFFSRFNKWISIITALVILIMAWSFFSIGVNEVKITHFLSQFNSDNIRTSEDEASNILPYLVMIKYYLKIGISATGLFSIILVISRFTKIRLALFGIIMILVSSPMMIFFVWVDENHLLFTLSLAISWSGLMVIGAMLMNYGIKGKY